MVSNSKLSQGKASTPAPLLSHSIDLRTFAAVLVQAQQGQRAWVGDFADEQIQVSADLFQIIQAARLFGRAA